MFSSFCDNGMGLLVGSLPEGCYMWRFREWQLLWRDLPAEPAPDLWTKIRVHRGEDIHSPRQHGKLRAQEEPRATSRIVKKITAEMVFH